MSLILALETSSKDYGVALGTTQEILVHSECRHDHPSFVSVGELVASLLEKTGADFSDIAEIGVDVGPGALSSVRAAVAYANGLAFSLGCIVFEVNSLELLAREAMAICDLPVLCMRKAEGGNAYAGFFAKDGSSKLQYGPRVEVIAELASDVANLCVAGAYRSEACDVLPDVQVHDTGIEAPSVFTLYRMLAEPDREPTRRMAMATPVNEAAIIFHAHRFS